MTRRRFVITDNFERLLLNLTDTLPKQADLFILQGPSTEHFDFEAYGAAHGDLAAILKKRTVTVVPWRNFTASKAEMMAPTSAVCIVGYPTLQPLLARFDESQGALCYVVPSLSPFDASSSEHRKFDCVAMDIPTNADDFHTLHRLQDYYTMSDDFVFFARTLRAHVENTEGIFKLYNRILNS